MRLPYIVAVNGTDDQILGCLNNNQTVYERFAYIRLDLGLESQFFIDFQFSCFSGRYYVDNIIADIILKLIDNTIVDGK